MAADLEKQEGTDLAALEELEARAAGASQRALGDERIRVPRLSVVQGTTREAPEDASPGEFYNSVTAENHGKSIEMLIAHFSRGRFYAELDEKTGERTGRTFVAGSEPVVPDHWPAEFAGQVFAELPAAEETYSAMVNAGEFEWGKGPPIATSFNFTGFVTDPAPEGDYVPVRLPLMRSNRPAADTIITLLRAASVPWKRAIRLNTDRVENRHGGVNHVVRVGGYGAGPDNILRRAAAELALAAEQVGMRDVSDATASEPAPTVEKTDGLDY